MREKLRLWSEKKCGETKAWISSFIKLCLNNIRTRESQIECRTEHVLKRVTKGCHFSDLSTQRREGYYCSISIVLLQCSICLSSTKSNLATNEWRVRLLNWGASIMSMNESALIPSEITSSSSLCYKVLTKRGNMNMIRAHCISS
jgi:hypothetical protein